MRSYPALQIFVSTALLTILPVGALADAMQDSGRAQADRVRMIAVNDVPTAYKKALLLKPSLPSSASAALNVRAINLLRLIEDYLGESVRVQAVNAAEAGDFKRAYRQSGEAAELSAKSARENASARMLDLASRYENDSKQRQLEELTRSNEMHALQQRWLWTVLGGSVALLVVAVLFLLHLRRSREEVRQLNIGLEQRVRERTFELHQSRQSLAEAQRIAHVGSWELAHAENRLEWSEEVFRIFGIDPQSFGFTYQDFLDAVHPDDRKMVADAFAASLEKKEPYEIEHRLLFPDGSIKYVYERCETSFGLDGTPMRSIGTVQDITERKHMEEALAARERNFRSLAENLPDNIARWDTRGRYLYINPVHSRTLGISADDIVGRELPDTHDCVKAALAQVVATGRAIAQVRQPALVDGEIQIHEVSLAPEYDAEGRIVSVVGLGRDMTEIYRMQDVITVREHELRSLAESSPGMMGAFYLRPDGAVCMPYVSSNIYELFGLHPQDVLEDASLLMGLNHPDDAQRVKDTIAESARTMTPWHCEFRMQHPAKGERWMESNTNPQPHPDGGTIWYGYVHDITERKRAEHAHEETRGRLQGVLKTIPDLVWMKDVDGVYLSCNHEFERFFGAKEAEIVGKTDYDFVDAELADFFRQKDREAIAAERICINEEWVTYADDGRRVLLEARKVPVYDEDGKVAGVLGVSRDVTERKRMEAALKESEARYRYNSNLLQAIIESPSSSVSIYAVDREYRFLAFNSRFRKAAKRLWNAEIELGMSMLDAIDNDAHREFTRQGFDHVLAGHGGFLESKEERIEDGKPVCEYHDNYGSPIYNDNGEVIGMTVFVLNTTERKEAEQKLKEALEFSEGIINAIPDLLFEVDAQGRYLNIWTHTPELLAARKEALLGKTVSDVLLPESAATILEALREAGEHDVCFGKVIHIDLSQGETWFELSVSKKPGGSPAANTFLVLSRDITERKRMEEKLAVREQEFRALAENSPDTIARYIPGGIRTYINPVFARLAGKPAHEMLGVMAADYQAAPQALTYRSALLHSLEGGEEGECEYTWPAHDGRLITSHIRIVPEFAADGKVASVLAVGRDITERKRMEAALKESETRYRYHFNQLQSMLESASSVSVFALDREYRYLFFNKRHKEGAKRIRGTDIDIGMNMIESIPDEAFREYCRQGFDRVLAGNSVFVGSKEKVDKDGALAYEYNDNFGSPIFNDEGEVIGLTVFSINTSERKQMEEALQRSEQLMRTVIDATPDWIFIKDREHRYQLANKGYANALHIAPEDFIGKNDLDLGFPEELVKGNPEKGIRGFWADDRMVLDTNETQVFPDDPATIDGAVHTFHTIKVPLRDVDGKASGVLAFARDITERKQLEAELRASRNFLDSVIDSVSDPIFVKDRQHRWTLLNDAFCAFIGHPRETLVGKSDYDFFPGEQAGVFWEKDELVFDSGQSNLNEEGFTSANGEEHYIQTKKTPFVSGDGREMLVGVIRDITERKHLEAAREAALAEAQRLAKLRSEFIAHMSHELRTPLNGILGYAQILGRDDKLNEKQHASVDVIRHSGEHLLRLIEDILDLARIESGRLSLDIDDIPLVRFLHVVSRIIGVKAHEKNVEFACELSPDLPQGIRGDEKRLRQVLLNLLSNAVKFTDQGKVTLSVIRVAPSRLAFAVSDTGIGIAPADRETIFKSFEQVSDAQHRIGGTGLGLSISRQLVRLMGGDIVVESHPGAGSTFWFELELPEAGIEPEVLRAASNDARRIKTETSSEPLVAPPQEEMQELHRLALLGSMRDIANYAEHIGAIDPRYLPFAAYLKRLASGFQSKTILAFVEGYLK